MARMRRRPRLSNDDPMRTRHMREDLGIDKLHLNPYFGHNAARALPARGANDPAGGAYDGIPHNRLKFQDLTNDEQATNSTDDRVLASSTTSNAGRAVGASHIKQNPHGVDPLGNANQADDVERAISGDHVKTLTLEGFHLKDTSIGNRAIGSSIDGGKLAKKSVPSNAIHALHGSKLTGKESIDWSLIKVKGVVFTHRLDETVEDLKRFMAKHYQKKGS